MRQMFPLSTDQFRRARVRRIAPMEPRLPTTAPLSSAARRCAVRANPELLAVGTSHGPIGRLAIQWRNWLTRQRWRRELQALDDRQLRDIGLSRLDIARVVRQQPGFWL